MSGPFNIPEHLFSGNKSIKCISDLFTLASYVAIEYFLNLMRTFCNQHHRIIDKKKYSLIIFYDPTRSGVFYLFKEIIICIS